MEYRVAHKETGEERTLTHSEVNDMAYNADERIIVFDTNLEAYYLLDDVHE
ncbi:hypothetical protein [Paenibacillus aceris]|uniref:Transcriptional regulator of viral defense system n=1 Tax=Paenibacillus aceris TaxID=869555 RepID=A0ABS4HRG3_9BACL|nr:hypothetical protein [Paenibacillus aceris]MBP1961197.1 putative transcriptional regulator of viral defense system [Paenibacillus aceris]NHW38014.1 hypothetical protein [Paenibacillus aceris]